MSENNDDDSEHKEFQLPRRGRTDQDIERKRRQKVLEVLSEHDDGLGFNELTKNVEGLISRATLRDRLEDYEDEGLIEMPESHRRGQKKIIRLEEKGKPPEGLEYTYKQWGHEVFSVWEDVLDMYNEEQDSVDCKQVIKYTLTCRFRWDLRGTVLASKADEEYSEKVREMELPDEAVPKLNEPPVVEEFYTTIAAELWKYYTEKIYGEAHIETQDKATSVRKDTFLRAFEWSIACRDQINEMWGRSPVPKERNL